MEPLLSRAAKDVDIKLPQNPDRQSRTPCIFRRQSNAAGQPEIPNPAGLLDGTFGRNHGTRHAAPDNFPFSEPGHLFLSLSRRTERSAGNDFKHCAKHRQCVFFLICRAGICCQAHLEDMTALGNVIPLSGYEDLPAMAASLKQAGILFGLHRRYCEIESLQAEETLLHQCIEMGCFLGVYEGTRHDACSRQDLVYYAKLQEIRCSGTQEIFLADLWRDRKLCKTCCWNNVPAERNRL